MSKYGSSKPKGKDTARKRREVKPTAAAGPSVSTSGPGSYAVAITGRIQHSVHIGSKTTHVHKLSEDMDQSLLCFAFALGFTLGCFALGGFVLVYCALGCCALRF